MRAALVSLAVLLAACADSSTSVDAGGAPRDAAAGAYDSGRGTSADASASSDAGALRDAGFSDSGLVLAVGRKLGAVPDRILSVSADESEVLYVSATGQLVSANPETTDTRVLHRAPDAIHATGDVTWFSAAPEEGGQRATLWTYRTRTGTTAPVARRWVSGFLYRSPDGEQAIVADGLTITGAAGSSTRTADLVLVGAAGTARAVLLTGISAGRYESGRITGPCRPGGTFTSTAVAYVALCRSPDSEVRELYRIDVETKDVRQIHANVIPFVIGGANGRFALYADAMAHIHGVGRGDRVIPLAEPAGVTSIAVLEGARFAYTNANHELRVASWPRMTPATVQALDVEALEAASPTGAHVVFRQRRNANGLRDLFLTETTTTGARTPLVLSPTPSAYPAESPFSADGAYVFWYANVDSGLIGDLYARAASGAGAEVLLGTRGYYFGTYRGDPNGVLMMVNARSAQLGQSRVVVADMAIRARDGSTPARILASGVNASDFELFPRTNRIAYRIEEGVNTGLWVGPLD